MNTVSHDLSHAAATSAESPQARLLVPLSRLRLSRRNVRKMGRNVSIPELAASIQRIGLLQNLIVTSQGEPGYYDVEAGGRRLAALRLLVKKKHIPEGYEVPCLCVADASARTVSLAENVQREAMHPADQFEAFAALVKEGRPIEDIAADFGVSALVVQRRLKLANVSPRLLADYRQGAVTLEQLMALAITDDHAIQEAAFYHAPAWQRSPHALRERLTAQEIDASDPRACFVGIDAYVAAGGGIVRDLFAEEGCIYLNDAPLLQRLAHEKLAALAEKVRAEGWAWVEATTHLTPADRHAFQDAPTQTRAPTAREARRLSSLQGRIDQVAAAIELAEEAGNDEEIEALLTRQQQLENALSAQQTSLCSHAPDVRAIAGVIVTLDHEGSVVIHRGLLREPEARALRTLERVRNGQADLECADIVKLGAKASKTGALTDRLAQRLSAHRTAALQIELARAPRIALAALVHRMLESLLPDDGGIDLPLAVRLIVQNPLSSVAPDCAASRAAVALQELQQQWRDRLSLDQGEPFDLLLALSQPELVQLLAVCVAASADATVSHASKAAPGHRLAQALGLDMSAWWAPTAEGYFGHLSKAAILEAVGEFAPSHVNRLAKLKKAELASEAERLVNGTGWMPAVFRQVAPTAEESLDALPPAEDSAEVSDDAQPLAA